MAGRKTVKVDRLRYRIMNGVLDTASRVVHGGKAGARLERTVFDANDIGPHEGLHRLADPRYKEWWYFDAHLDDGRVISTAIVFSIVKTHYFLWIWDPRGGSISEEIMHDGKVSVNAWGARGLAMHGELLGIDGSHGTGYTLEFKGRNLRGRLVFSEPIAGRAEHHHGAGATHYSLYQVPHMNVSGSITRAAKAAGPDIGDGEVHGVGYHDHWWCISHRVTRWNWLQVKFPNGLVVGFYDGRYGYHGEDLHRYCWAFAPGGGYTHFDQATLSFTREKNGWKLEVSGPESRLHLEARPCAQRFEFKPVIKAGVLLGEVQYYQYPITATARLQLKGQSFQLESRVGILEWDWLAVW